MVVALPGDRDATPVNMPLWTTRSTVNDFADLASDELTGSYDVIKGEKVKIKGYLEDFALSKKEADDLIMSARDKAYKD